MRVRSMVMRRMIMLIWRCLLRRIVVMRMPTVPVIRMVLLARLFLCAMIVVSWPMTVVMSIIGTERLFGAAQKRLIRGGVATVHGPQECHE